MSSLVDTISLTLIILIILFKGFVIDYKIEIIPTITALLFEDNKPESVFTYNVKDVNKSEVEFLNLGQLQLSLYESSALANNQAASDGVLILFDTNGNNDVDSNDAPDIPNLDENFSINNNGVLLSIESRAAPLDQEELQLEVNTYRNTNYTIVAEGMSMQNAIAVLNDNYTNTSTEIPQTGIVNYDYSVDSEVSQSVASNRFKIIFNVETLSVLTTVLDNMKLYPNPSDLGRFYINIPLSIDTINIVVYNVQGIELYSKHGIEGGRKVTVIPNDSVRSGMYFVKLESQGKSIVKKLIVN